MAFILTIVLLALAGAGLTVAGVYLLAGLGWAAIAAGAFTIAAAGLMTRGLAPRG